MIPLFLCIGGIWCFGWGATCFATGAYWQPKFWHRTQLFAKLFFIWPCVLYKLKPY